MSQSPIVHRWHAPQVERIRAWRLKGVQVREVKARARRGGFNDDQTVILLGIVIRSTDDEWVAYEANRLYAMPGTGQTLASQLRARHVAR